MQLRSGRVLRARGDRDGRDRTAGDKDGAGAIEKTGWRAEGWGWVGVRCEGCAAVRSSYARAPVRLDLSERAAHEQLHSAREAIVVVIPHNTVSGRKTAGIPGSATSRIQCGLTAVRCLSAACRDSSGLSAHQPGQLSDGTAGGETLGRMAAAGGSVPPHQQRNLPFPLFVLGFRIAVAMHSFCRESSIYTVSTMRLN